MCEIEKWTSKMKPQGTERYFEINESGYFYPMICCMRDSLWRQSSAGPFYSDYMHHVLRPSDSMKRLVKTNVAMYEGKIYMVELGYLYVSTVEDANQGDILAKAEMNIEKKTPLAVNDYGIFVIDAKEYGAQVSWFTHEGEQVKNILIKGDVQQTYICGKLLFYIKLEESRTLLYSAYWMNMETGEEHSIYRARHKGNESNSIMRAAYVSDIFGNERGAVLRLHFIYLNCNEKGSSMRQGGWYYYDFDKISCLSNSQGDPSAIYDNPGKYRKWISDCLDKYGHDPYYINIMAINMEKNLMWVSREQNGNGPWEPMNITPDLEKRSRPDLPVWEWPEGIEDLKWTGVCYFDGDYFYNYIDYYSFGSFAPDGKRQIWPVKSESTDFMVLDSYVRINGEWNGDDQSEEVFYSYFPASHEFGGVSAKSKLHYWGVIDDSCRKIKFFAQDEKEERDAYQVSCQGLVVGRAEMEWDMIVESAREQSFLLSLSMNHSLTMEELNDMECEQDHIKEDTDNKNNEE